MNEPELHSFDSRFAPRSHIMTTVRLAKNRAARSVS